MALSALFMGPDDWRISLIVYAALALPALAGMVSRRWRGAATAFVAMLPCSLAFFVLSNFAVFAFSGIYTFDGKGLTECYLAALPFLAKHGRRRHVLDRGAVRRRLGGAEPAGADAAGVESLFPSGPYYSASCPALCRASTS